MSSNGAPPGAPQAPQTLETFLTGRGPMAAPELVPLLGAVMDQLSTLHGAGQYHGNLSPDTITVTPTPEGHLAAWLPPTTAPAAGTWPFFLSPEQLMQGGQVGYWSDIYAMAGVLHRALTGQPPFSGANAEEVRQGHLQAPPPPVTSLRSDLAPELNAVLLQGLAKAPADRQASMQALRQAVEGAAMSAPPPVAAGYAPAAPVASAPVAYAPTAYAPNAYAPAAAPAAYAPAAPGYAPTAPGAGPQPPQMVPPASMPNATASGPKMAIIIGIGVLTAVGGLVFSLLAGGSSDGSVSSSATVQDKAAPKIAQNTPRKAAQRPVAADPTPLDLPGVGEKLKTPVAPARKGAAGHALLNLQNQPWLGGRNAVVVITLWSDFQCPFARRVNPLLASLVKKYPKDLKVVWFDFPLRFHKQAMPAAIAARSVFQQGGNQKFWRFHNKVFANSKNISRDTLVEWAKETGANGDEVKRDLEAGRIRKLMDDSIRLAKQIGVRGTPTLFVNGLRFKGRRSVDGFSKAIDAEIAAAKRDIGAGKTTRDKYYAYLMQGERGRQAAKAGAGPKTGKRKRRKLNPKIIYRIPITKDEPWKGAKRPLVTMVLWSDFECPYCKYMACTLEEVLRKYPKTVRLVFRHNPMSFHHTAMPAAEATLAALAQKGRRGFWRMYAKVFPLKHCPRNTSKVKLRDWLEKMKSRHPKLTRSTLEGFAKKVRLNMTRFRRAMDSHSHRAHVKAQASASKKLGARGTPALFVNGRYVRGYRNFARLKVIIDSELAKARRLVKRGVSKRKLYHHITSGGSRTLVYLD
jgi:protein-disulfide isomerase